MKRAIVVIILAVAITAHIYSLSWAVSWDTRTMSLEETPVNKFLRGGVNSLTFIAELPASIWDTIKNKGIAQGCTLGLAEGIVTSLARLGTGLFDVITFVIPPYDKPILTPEYAIQSFKDKVVTCE